MKKVIIVTRASSGIGKATALQLIQEGHTVYGLARRVENMQDLIKAGGNAMSMDVTQHDQVKAVIAEIIKRENRIDVLVNNAGFAIWGAVEDVSYEDAKRQFEVNIFGLAKVTKAVLPSMRNQESGTIINISSIGGKIYTPLGAWYHATKHALEGWSDCLRMEVNDLGINVVIVEPGAIRTEFGEVLNDNFSKSIDGHYAELGTVIDKVMKSVNDPGQSSPPSVIADVISKAIAASRPKTRYAAGNMAAQTLFFRKWFSDRFFDKTMLNMMTNMAKKA
ncbi:oxidoreductase [Muricauda sp. 2012CJ35-5]|uniref:Oxidoreductase n=1 Tax=Flagellimonas spongiicola TaxID=2942208 RepID=A0ABT0PPY4_9FLAO|nr:oxidoreductase [Allomuricauda spongiicola]MCL6273346.1 oxidoreductase [Allomuricauda spongiicola]